MKSFSQFVNESKDEEVEVKLNKIGKVLSYFNSDSPKNEEGDYEELKGGKPSTADGFVAGENLFIIDKNKTTIDGHDVYKAVDEEFDTFVIYVDDSGVLYTDDDEKKVLYKRILQ